MPISCREKDALKLEALLAKGEMSIQGAAMGINRSVRYVHSIVKQFPTRFSCIGLGGTVGSWCIGVAGDRPIYLVNPFGKRK